MKSVVSLRVMMLNIIISQALLLLCLIAKGQQDFCVPFPKDPACGCTLKDGKTINLTSEGKQNGQPA